MRLSRTACSIVLLVCLFGLAGCASIRETHYFKSDATPGQTPNFFRLDISGSTGLSSARYLSGYFDEDVVNQYFNEIGQPEKGRLVPVAQPPKDSTGVSGSANQSNHGPSDAKNPALILLLSGNSDEIANQLGALAQSQDFTASLVSLVAAPKFQAAAAAEQRLTGDQMRGHVSATLGDQLVTALPDAPTPQLVQSRLLEFVNQLAADMGATSPFQTLDEAAAWLQNNRTRLRQGGSAQ